MYQVLGRHFEPWAKDQQPKKESEFEFKISYDRTKLATHDLLHVKASVKYNGKQRSFVDGPFAETKELVAGYTIINVKSREQAIEWTKRYPNPSIDGGVAEIEVRQYFELEDFGDSPAVERFRKLGVGE